MYFHQLILTHLRELDVCLRNNDAAKVKGKQSQPPNYKNSMNYTILEIMIELIFIKMTETKPQLCK